MEEKTVRLMDGKGWRCKNGHLVGVMVRERVNGGLKVYRLYQLTCALEHDPQPDQALTWKARHEGTTHDILCEVCETRKTWWAGAVVGGQSSVIGGR